MFRVESVELTMLSEIFWKWVLGLSENRSRGRTRRRGARPRRMPGVDLLESRILLTVSFSQPTNYSVYGASYEVQTADLNADGILDLVGVNRLRNHDRNLSVLLGRGDGTFQSEVNYSAGSQTTAVTIADINNDGSPDLLAPNHDTNTISVFFNNNDRTGTFRPGADIPTGNHPVSVVVANLDDTQGLDLAVANQLDDTIGIYYGNNTGEFRYAGVCGTGDGPTQLLAADVNSDGFADLVTANCLGNSVSVLRAIGNNAFQPATNYSTGLYTLRVQLADVVGDGELDLVATNTLGQSLSVLSGTGDGTFAAAATITLPSYPLSIAIADYNRDGLLDVATTLEVNNEVIVLEGVSGTTKSLTPLVPVPTGAGPNGLAAGDFNGDGAIDLVTANWNGSALSVLLNQSTPVAPHLTVAAPAIADAGGLTNITVSARDGASAVLAGFTGAVQFASSDPHIVFLDGATVNFTANDQGVKTVRVKFRNNGVQTVSARMMAAPERVAGAAVTVVPPPPIFGAATPLAVAGPAFDVATADLNADGILDLVGVNRLRDHDRNLSVLLGHGDGTFGTEVTYVAGRQTHAVTIVDVNNDGSPDLLAPNHDTNTITVYLNNNDGTGTFHPGTDIPTGNNPMDVVVANLNSSGGLDLAVTNRFDNTVGVYFGLGNGQFVFQRTVSTGAGPVQLVAEQLTANGHVDLIVANSFGNSVSVLRGNGDGTFVGAGDYFTGSYTLRVEVADLNNDGRKDLVATNTLGKTLSVLRGNGDRTFQTAQNYSVPANPWSVAIADFNRDGILDVATPQESLNSIIVLPGQGDGTLGTGYIFATGVDPNGLANGDFNGDSVPDLVSADWTSGTLSVLLNQTPELNFSPLPSVGGPYSTAEGLGLTLDASASIDPENDPLTYTWDLNNDGVFGDAVGATPTLNWSELAALGLDGRAAPYSVRVRVNDGHNHLVTSDAASLSIANRAPVADLGGTVQAVRYQTLSFTLSATDPSPLDQQADFTFQIDWDGNGTIDETVVGPSGTIVNHVFAAVGTFNVRVVAADQDGALSAPKTLSVQILSLLSQGGDLLIGGTSANDTFTFTLTIPAGTTTEAIIVKLNTTTLGTFSPTGSIRGFGGTGTDAFVVNGDNTNNSFLVDLNQIRMNAWTHVGDGIESFTVNASGGNDAITVSGGAATINGGAGTDKLIAALVGENDWNVTASNAGSLNGSVPFSLIESLVGGGLADRFHLSNGVGVTGQIDGGGGGLDELDYSLFTTAVAVNLQTGIATKTGGIVSIEKVTGGSATTDTFTLTNTANIWRITGQDSGLVNNAYSYAGFEKLVGGTLDDAFQIEAFGRVTTSVSGGSGVNTLDFSLYGAAMRVDLALLNATGVGSFSGISTFRGGNFGDTLTGPNTTAAWTVTSSSGGTVSTFSFSGFEALAGGTGADTFRVTAGIVFSGGIAGGAGAVRDILNYSTYTIPVVVNLLSGTATGWNQIAGFENIVGGLGNDTLVGNNADNQIDGGNGNDVILGGGGVDALNGGNDMDILIGGTGGDTIRGGAGDDVVIGGTVAYFDETTQFLDYAALAALMAEWSRAGVVYATRVAHLNGSVAGGLNGGFRLSALTIFDDAVLDVLVGDAGTDWFFSSPIDQVTKTTGEVVTIV